MGRELTVVQKLRRAVSARVRSVERARGSRRPAGVTLEALLGLPSFQELARYVEARFSRGMRWDNWGCWHLDHIRPVASFSFVDPADYYACFGAANLRPIWATENLKKGARYGPSTGPRRPPRTAALVVAGALLRGVTWTCRGAWRLLAWLVSRGGS